MLMNITITSSILILNPRFVFQRETGTIGKTRCKSLCKNEFENFFYIIVSYSKKLVN